MSETPETTPEPPVADVAAGPLDAAWRELVTQWSDPAAHKTFVVLAAQVDALPEAARRYREAKAQGETVVVDGYRVPGSGESRREIAERGLQLVLAQALARFDSSPRAEPRSKAGVFLPVAALMMLFGLSFSIANLTRNPALVSLPSLAVQALIVALIPWKRLQRR